MALLHLDSLPPKVTKGTVVRLLIQVGDMDRKGIGTIELRGRSAVVQVPDDWIDRLVARLDGCNLGNHLIRAGYGGGMASGPSDHFSRFQRLIELEAAAEARRTTERIRHLSGADAERSGESLVDLVVQEYHLGLGGRTLVVLAKRKTGEVLPWTRLGTGSPVLISPQLARDASTVRGVVSRRTDRQIEVAVAGSWQADDDAQSYRIDLSSDEVARRRQQSAMQRAAGSRGNRLAHLRKVLLGETSPQFQPGAASADARSSLNGPQQEAVDFSLSARDVAIIHGPPGTGKTTTLVELIREAVVRGDTVLACAPSNLAVDNLFAKLLTAGEAAIRIGHPARVQPELREHTLDLIVDAHPDVKLARRLVREAGILRAKASRYTRAKPAPGERRELRDEAKRLIEDARRLEMQVVQSVLDSADVVCATNTGLDSEILGQRQFDLAVIDEACQSTEPGCWIPLLRCDRVVLAGDHCQLPPTVLSQEAAREGLGVSLLERLMERYGENVSRQLTVQYRMHQEIMEFSSSEFYEGTLVADSSVARRRLCDLPGVAIGELTQSPVRFIDTAGAGYDEEQEPDGESRRNGGEAELVASKVESLVAAGLAACELAVIAPYAAQVRWLRERLRDEHPGLEIDTVDGFQGREKEAVIISLVRSNPQGEIGFLADQRRMNVALTRARRTLIVIGDSATIGGHPFYARLLEYFELTDAYHTVWEEA